MAVLIDTDIPCRGGANNYLGIGLDPAKQLLDKPSTTVRTVIPTSRGKEPSNSLSKLLRIGDRGMWVQLDILNRASIDAAVVRLQDVLGDEGIDVLVNNAGIQLVEPGWTSGTTMLQRTLETNVTAVDNITRALLPLLRKEQQKKIVNLTSTVGSMTLASDFAAIPSPSYKISKAALDMMTVQYALNSKGAGFIATCISPGWLMTDMGGANAHLSPEVGVRQTIKIIEELSSKENGVFKDIFVDGHPTYSGKNAPW